MHLLLLLIVKAHAYSAIAVAPSSVTYPQMTVSATAKNPVNPLLAEEAAIDKCKTRGGEGCRAFSVDRACLAVAINDEFASFFSATSDAQAGAQAAALEKCRSQSGNSNCTLRTSVCDFPTCKKAEDYGACLRQGDTMYPGSAKEFCHSQFC